jgi:hypothetical protein
MLNRWMHARRLLLGLCAAAGVACVPSHDRAYTARAIQNPGLITIGSPSPSPEVRASDGATFRFVSDVGGTTCFTGMIDNRLGDGATLTYSLALYTDPTAEPIETAISGPIKVMNERSIVDQGFVPTGQLVIGPDGRPGGQIVQVGTVEQPVLDVEICFQGTSIGGSQFVVLNRNPRVNDRGAPSYVAWRRQ